MTPIPKSREGYALDQASKTVHHRWAVHARGLPRVRGAREVTTWLGAEPTVCAQVDCFPPPAAPKPKVERPRASTRERRVVDVELREPVTGTSDVHELTSGEVTTDVTDGTTEVTPAQVEREAADMPEAGPEEQQP